MPVDAERLLAKPRAERRDSQGVRRLPACRNFLTTELRGSSPQEYRDGQLISRLVIRPEELTLSTTSKTTQAHPLR